MGTAKKTIEDQSTDYTLDEIDEELDMLSRRGQQVKELLEAGKKDGFGGHPEFKQAQRSVLGEITAQVTGAEVWLEKVRNDLYMAAVTTQRTRAVDTRQGRADMKPVPVRILPGHPATQSGGIIAVDSAAQPGLAQQHHRRPGREQGVTAGGWSRWAAGASGCSGPAREDPGIDQPVSPTSGGGTDPLDGRRDEAPVQGLADV